MLLISQRLIWYRPAELPKHHHHHHHHVQEGLGMFSVPWSSKWNWSLHLFLGRPMFLRHFGLYCSACLGILFVSILCTCCSHYSWFLNILFINYTLEEGWCQTKNCYNVYIYVFILFVTMFVIVYICSATIITVYLVTVLATRLTTCLFVDMD